MLDYEAVQSGYAASYAPLAFVVGVTVTDSGAAPAAKEMSGSVLSAVPGSSAGVQAEEVEPEHCGSAGAHMPVAGAPAPAHCGMLAGFTPSAFTLPSGKVTEEAACEVMPPDLIV
jgi:hypothetical protein